MSTVGLLTTCHTKVLHVTERSPFNLQLRFFGCNARSIVNSLEPVCSSTSGDSPRTLSSISSGEGLDESNEENRCSYLLA